MSETINVGATMFNVGLVDSGNVLPKYSLEIKPISSIPPYNPVQDATKERSAFLVKEDGLGNIIDIQI
jgi:hypothetical protein